MITWHHKFHVLVRTLHSRKKRHYISLSHLSTKQDVLLQGNVVEQWADLVAPLYKIKSKLCIIHSFGEEKAKYMRTVT